MKHCSCTGAALAMRGLTFIHAKGCKLRVYGIIRPQDIIRKPLKDWPETI